MTAFIRPEGYLVTRFIVGLAGVATRRSIDLRRSGGSRDSLRRIHDGPAIPGLFVPLRIAEAYRGPGDGARRPDPARVRPGRGRRAPDRGGPAWPTPLELRPCHNDLLNANFIDDGARIRIIDWEYAGMGDPFFDLGNFSINHELTPDEDEILLAAYDGDGPA